MKSSNKLAIPFIFALIIANCSTYMQNRKKDIQDIVTIGAEYPNYGGGLRIGPLVLGFWFQGGETEMGKMDKGKGWGNRGGTLGKYQTQQLVFGLLGGETFYSGDVVIDSDGIVEKEYNIPVVKEKRDNIKSFKVKYFSFFNDPPIERQRRKKDAARKEMLEKILYDTNDPSLLNYIPKENLKPYGYPNSYLFQIEGFIGIYGGLRIGINLAEVLDFIIGLTTIDILEDDGKE